MQGCNRFHFPRLCILGSVQESSDEHNMTILKKKITGIFADSNTKYAAAFGGLCANMYTPFEHLSHVSKPYYPQYAAPYAGAFRRIWRIFQGLSRNLSGSFVRPLQGLKKLRFILFIALSRFSRLFGLFLHFLSLSLKSLAQLVKPLSAPLTYL